MAQGSYIDVPSLQDKAYKKALRKFQGTKSSIISTPYKLLSREEEKARKTRQWLTEIAAAWKLLDAPTKAIWKSYAANISRSNWVLYVMEYAYRKKYELSIPPSPTELHQMMGLKITNPTGSGTVKAWRYDIVITGPIDVRFSYKKTESAATSGIPFRVYCEAWYMEAGENKSETHTFDAPSGNVDWTQVNFSFGTSGRYYFELIISFELTDYQASVILDNFVVEDNIGELVDEPWHVKSGKTWYYQVKTRKMGWEFSPAIGQPYIEVVYTGS